MKFFILFATVPCIWAFNEWAFKLSYDQGLSSSAFNESHIQCPDGSHCPIRKTCCDASDETNLTMTNLTHCCEIKDHEKDNKKLVTAFPSHFNKNDSLDFPDDKGVCSNGTMCSADWCCKYERAECCSNSTSCCPENHKCCGTAPRLWCCKTNQRCADTYFYCVAGASSISSTFLSIIMMVVIAVSLKHC